MSTGFYAYKKEFNSDGTEKHVTIEGSRFHVISYSTGKNMICSESNCEINKMSDKKDNAPERIKAWKSTLYGQRWDSSGQVSPLAYNTKTHEYILKSTADKHMQDALMELDTQRDNQLEEILKPIRDVYEAFIKKPTIFTISGEPNEEEVNKIGGCMYSFLMSIITALDIADEVGK